MDLGHGKQRGRIMKLEEPEMPSFNDLINTTPPATPSEGHLPSSSLSLASGTKDRNGQWTSAHSSMMMPLASKLDYSPPSLDISPNPSLERLVDQQLFQANAQLQGSSWMTRNAPVRMSGQPPPTLPPTPGLLNNNQQYHSSSLIEDSLLFMDPAALLAHDTQVFGGNDPLSPWYMGLLEGSAMDSTFPKANKGMQSQPIKIPSSMSHQPQHQENQQRRPQNLQQHQWTATSSASSAAATFGSRQSEPVNQSYQPLSPDEQWYQWQMLQQQVARQMRRESELVPRSNMVQSPVSNGPRFVCQIDYCGKTFTTKQSLKSHAPTHDLEKEKPFVCSLCGSAFRRKHDLARHHRSLHAVVKPFKCQFCGKEYARSDALKRHLQSKAHNLPESLTLAVIAASRQSPHPSYVPSTLGDLSRQSPSCPEEMDDMDAYLSENI